jgi:hypothetical protein
MRSKLLRNTIFVLLFAIGLTAACFWYLHRLSVQELGRIEELAHRVKSLRVDESGYQEAKLIAEQFGATKYEGDWGARDCTQGYFEHCTYQISLHAPSMSKILQKFTWARRIGLGAWCGTAHIFVEQGKVAEYYFSMVFETSDQQWRGFGTEEFKILSDRAVSARISNSYMVSRNDVAMSAFPNGLGFSLDSMLTPQATENERKRAWHFDFSCLASTRGCNEICDVSPDAWADFYSNRGRFDVQKYGSRYAFCTKNASLR